MYLDNNDKCPKGGEHDFFGEGSKDAGWYESRRLCAKCGQPDHWVVHGNIEQSGECPKGGQHFSCKSMGNWGQPTNRRCLKCGEAF